MKTYNDLYDQIVSFENLILAARKARAGKRFRSATTAFDAEFEKNIIALKCELQNETYECGPYREFYVQEAKKRFICAAPYRDRVVHHALCNIIEPIFDRTFVFDSYACRTGKGTHKAVERFSSFLRNPQNQYVLKCDIKKYFQSIDHDVLLDGIRKKIACRKTLSLIRKIIDSANTLRHKETALEYFKDDNLFTCLQRAKGIPIGNLTSQFFANVYLNDFDHYLKEDLHCRYYIRYVDDFVICHKSKEHLHAIKKVIVDYLDGYRLHIHEDKSQVIRASQGIDFLGFRVFPTHRLVRKSNVIRYKRKLRLMQKQYETEFIELGEARQRIMSWLGHVKWANSFRMRKIIFDQIVFKRAV